MFTEVDVDSLIWTRVSLAVSHRRLSHTSTQVGSYLFIIGGHDGTAYSSDILFYNLGRSCAWLVNCALNSSSSEPAVRASRGLRQGTKREGIPCDDHCGQQTFRVWRGQFCFHLRLLSRAYPAIQFNGHDVFDDVHILDLAGAAYLPQVMSFRIDVE